MSFELTESSLVLNFIVVASGGRLGVSGEFTFSLSGI
jgi:hypothetical protein